MSEEPRDTAAEAQAVRRFYALGGVRIGALAGLMLGVAIANGAVDAPYWLGAFLAIAGMLGFFFGPYFLAKRWNSDRSDKAK